MNVYVIWSEELDATGEWQFSIMHTARNSFERAKKVVRQNMKKYGSGDIEEIQYNSEYNWGMCADNFVCGAKRIKIIGVKK